ncbi:cell division and transport-associated protein TolR [Tepidamorphus gemmatus]|uniref:Cell division and transport-associated protein TolR n=1 Tax=Tepidamorphus gemmatus TaxID=747076 RepID=A0A4R3MI94_9HYPH|nr:protein TolR [Tepidamorphus gemmatus]TCT13352.1 cell division and transport-associated protein TolR [Tepidamorphus gemmatus]
MGASLAGNGGAGRRRGRRYRPMSEINVTPFVDVMLVLLIVFMVTAPLLTVGVPIDLPETQAKPLEGQKEPLTVSVDNQGRVFLQDTEITVEELVPKLTAIAERGVEERVFVRGDRTVDYGTVMRVMGRLNQAGFRRIALVTDIEQGQR